MCIPIVISVLCDVTHPGKSLVSALLDNLQVADLDAGDREVRNLKLDSYGCFALRFAFCLLVQRYDMKVTRGNAHRF